MTFKEYLEKNEKAIENMDFENIDELKKFADKEKIVYSDEELKQAWSHIKSQNVSDDDALDDDALDAVSGGKSSTSTSTQTTTTTTTTTTKTTTDDHSDHSTTTKWVHTGGGDINGDITFN